MSGNRYRIEAVFNAGRIIELVSNAGEALGAAEISARLDLTSNTAFRVCETLDELRMLKKVQDKYILGDALAHAWARYKTRREADLVRIQTELKNLEIEDTTKSAQEGKDGGEKAA